MMRVWKYLAVMAAAVVLGQTAWAADGGQADSKQLHFIGGVGVSIDASNIDDWGQHAFSGTNFEYKSGGGGADIYAGVEVMKWLTVRLGHRKMGDQTSDVYGPSNTYMGEGKLETKGNYLAVDALYPINQSVLLGVTVGSMSWDQDQTMRYANGSPTDRNTESGTDPFFGLRGRVLINQGKAAITAFLTGYKFSMKDAPKDLQYSSLGVGVELRI